MKKVLLSVIILMGIGISVFAQKKSGKEKRGDKYYFVYSFGKAIDAYTHAKNLSLEGQRRLAKSYSDLNETAQAEEAYSKLTGTPGGNLPLDDYNYARVLQANGKYELADVWMGKFIDSLPGDLRAKDYAANHSGRSNLSEDKGKYKTDHLNFNTDAEDFGPCYYKNQLVFSSSRTESKKKYNWNGKPFLDMYMADLDGDQLKTPSIFDKSLNGKLHDGPASFNKDGTYMAFTRNDYSTKKKNHVVRIQICFSTYKDGKWSTPEPFALNNTNYSVGQPCLSADGNTMYFSSDMPGGCGGADIYRVKKDTVGTWGVAENLGDKINTEGDELFPFFEENNGILFFSSNGRFGLGGLDIFIAPEKDAGFGVARNAGFPVNTANDDFAFIVNDKLTKGYLSTNRAGGSGDDDIYSVDIIKDLDIGKRLQGIAKDKDANPIPNTAIALLDEKDKVIDSLTTKADGAYTFLVDAGKNFKLVGKKDNYLKGEALANTFGREFTIKADVVLLNREDNIAKQITVGADLGKILELNPVNLGDLSSTTAYFDLDKYNIRPDAEVELGKVVKVMNDYPEMNVEVRSYTDCRASKEYNQILSDKRAKVSAWYIKKRITKPERVSGKGFGKTKMVNGCACDGDVISDCTEDQHQQNRRSEFIIMKNTPNNNNLLTDVLAK